MRVYRVAQQVSEDETHGQVLYYSSLAQAMCHVREMEKVRDGYGGWPRVDVLNVPLRKSGVLATLNLWASSSGREGW